MTRGLSSINSIRFYNLIFDGSRLVSEIGFSDVLSLAQIIGIVGRLFLTLYFSKRQIQSLSIGQQTSVLNDLNEKYHKLAEIVMEDPSLGKVIDKEGKPSRELAFSFYPMDMFSCISYASKCWTILNGQMDPVDEKLFSERNDRGNMETIRAWQLVWSCLSEFRKRWASCRRIEYRISWWVQYIVPVWSVQQLPTRLRK